MNKSVKHPQKRQGYVIQRLAESVRIRPSLTSQMTTFQWEKRAEIWSSAAENHDL